MIIREQKPGDAPAVRRVVDAAFGLPDESRLIEALRQSGDAVISLVAEDDGEIVGQVLFSKLLAPERCLALAPVSVDPNRQRQGIGSLLIREGLARAASDDWLAVFVLGEPAYYTRFGFSLADADKFETEYPKTYFMALELSPRALGRLGGAVVYAPPFQALT